MFPYLANKQLSVANFPSRVWTSLCQVGLFIPLMPSSFYGLTSIPLWLTLKPMNLPDCTPNVQLVGFNAPCGGARTWKFSLALLHDQLLWTIWPTYHPHRLISCHPSSLWIAFDYPLIGGIHIYQPKRHYLIVTNVTINVKNHMSSIAFDHLDLIVSRMLGIHEADQLVVWGSVD